MQISKADYEKMCKQLEVLKTELDREKASNKDLADRVIAGNRILQTIIRAANGFPLIDSSRGDRVNAMMGATYLGSNYDNPHPCVPLTNEELLRADVQRLQELVLTQESRLSAVRAIAEFAQEHKL